MSGCGNLPFVSDYHNYNTLTGLLPAVPKRKDCSALMLNGQRCDARATHDYEGLPCCWVHFKCATSPARTQPLRWYSVEVVRST